MIDVMIAMVITGLAVAATMALFASGTQAQGAASQMTIAMRLAKDVFEYSLTLPHATVPGVGINDVADLNGQTFGSGGTVTSVIDSTGSAIPGFGGWSQVVELKDVDPDTLQDTAGGILPERPKRLIVSVKYRNKTTYTHRWLVAPVLQHS